MPLLTRPAFASLVRKVKLDTGQVTILNRPFSLPEALADVRAAVQHSARTRRIEVSFDLSDKLRGAIAGFNCVGDIKRIQQVLTNLCVNAIKFTVTPPGLELWSAADGSPPMALL